MKNVPFLPYFFLSLFGHPLRQMAKIPSKLSKSAWIFVCDLFMYKAFTCGHILQIKLENKIFVLTKSPKNHFFQFWWNGGHIPYDD